MGCPGADRPGFRCASLEQPGAGSRGFSLSRSGSLGGMARVIVEAAGDETIVRVLSRRRIAKQTQAREDYASEILSQIEDTSRTATCDPWQLGAGVETVSRIVRKPSTPPAPLFSPPSGSHC
jgi:hypothetical protein